MRLMIGIEADVKKRPNEEGYPVVEVSADLFKLNPVSKSSMFVDWIK